MRKTKTLSATVGFSLPDHPNVGRCISTPLGFGPQNPRLQWVSLFLTPYVGRCLCTPLEFGPKP